MQLWSPCVKNTFWKYIQNVARIKKLCIVYVVGGGVVSVKSIKTTKMFGRKGIGLEQLSRLIDGSRIVSSSQSSFGIPFFISTTDVTNSSIFSPRKVKRFLSVSIILSSLPYRLLFWKQCKLLKGFKKRLQASRDIRYRSVLVLHYCNFLTIKISRELQSHIILNY